MLLLSVGYDTCPHGKFLSIGPYTWIVQGESCGNLGTSRAFSSIRWIGDAARDALASMRASKSRFLAVFGGDSDGFDFPVRRHLK
jgi:hypothetical protein